MKWFARKTQIRSFDEDASGVGALGQRFAGTRQVPIEKIVGTVDRGCDLRADFMPILKPHGDQRFARIRELMERGAALPPVELYKLGERYYVMDGHHRVAAARKIGQLDMDAVITEFQPGPAYRLAAA